MLGLPNRPLLAFLPAGLALLMCIILITWMLLRGNGLITKSALQFRYGTTKQGVFRRKLLPDVRDDPMRCQQWHRGGLKRITSSYAGGTPLFHTGSTLESFMSQCNTGTCRGAAGRREGGPGCPRRCSYSDFHHGGTDGLIRVELGHPHTNFHRWPGQTNGQEVGVRVTSKDGGLGPVTHSFPEATTWPWDHQRKLPLPSQPSFFLSLLVSIAITHVETDAHHVLQRLRFPFIPPPQKSSLAPGAPKTENVLTHGFTQLALPSNGATHSHGSKQTLQMWSGPW